MQVVFEVEYWTFPVSYEKDSNLHLWEAWEDLSELPFILIVTLVTRFTFQLRPGENLKMVVWKSYLNS